MSSGGSEKNRWFQLDVSESVCSDRLLENSPEDDQSILIETSSWNQPPQLIRDSHYMVLPLTFPYCISEYVQLFCIFNFTWIDVEITTTNNNVKLQSVLSQLHTKCLGRNARGPFSVDNLTESVKIIESHLPCLLDVFTWQWCRWGMAFAERARPSGRTHI